MVTNLIFNHQNFTTKSILVVKNPYAAFEWSCDGCFFKNPTCEVIKFFLFNLSDIAKISMRTNKIFIFNLKFHVASYNSWVFEVKEEKRAAVFNLGVVVGEDFSMQTLIKSPRFKTQSPTNFSGQKVFKLFGF